jgi:hypothetical protein
VCALYVYIFLKFSLPFSKQNSVEDKSSTVSSEDIAKNHVASEDAEVGGLLVTCNMQIVISVQFTWPLLVGCC